MHRWKPLQKPVIEITCDSHTPLAKIHRALGISNAEIIQVEKNGIKTSQRVDSFCLRDLLRLSVIIFSNPTMPDYLKKKSQTKT